MVNADRQYIEYNLLDSYILLIGITFNPDSKHLDRFFKQNKS